MYFPLGILYIAAVVKNAGMEVRIVDMRDGEKPMPKAEFYGFSCNTPEITKAKELAGKVKGRTIVGGGHASLKPHDCDGYFDYVVRGEGERVIVPILKDMLPPGIVNTERIGNLDSVPYPAWDMVTEPFSEELFAGERYGKGEKAATIIGSRGCPFDCHFCGNLFRVPVVYRSVPNIVGELWELKKRDVKHFRFEDDNFTIHPQFENLCLDIKKVGIRWKCHTRSELLTVDKAKLMHWAGCEECGLGVESADNKVLKINNKKETREDHIRAVQMLREAGIRSKTYMMAGLPGETEDTLIWNQAFFREAKPDKWTLSTFTPYPGTAVYENPAAFGITILDWDYSKWWNFAEDRFVHELNSEPREITWDRYERLYKWLRSEEWK